MAQFVQAVSYKREGCGFDSRLGHWEFSLTRSFNGLTKMRAGFGVKAASVWGCQPCRLHVPIVYKPWKPQPPGTLRASSFTFRYGQIPRCTFNTTQMLNTLSR